jgi:hypothetical protein
VATQERLTIILRTALDTNKYRNVHRSPISIGGDRLQQYIEGLDRLFALPIQHTSIQFLLVDNTIRAISDFPTELTKMIPKKVKLIASRTNKFGRFNKGAGDIETMRFLFKKNLVSSDNYFHFEPRLYLQDPSFLFDFLEHPRPMICLSKENGLATTGYYGADKRSFTKFVNDISLIEMCLKSTSIEKLLLKHAQKFSWEIQKISEFCVRIDPVTGSERY